MYGAMGFESLTQGMGTGAFAVLLLRLTEKRFSATQYALFSSLFGLPRLLAGPVSGFLVDAVGWKIFFWSTIMAGLPGLALLQRFAPLGMREPSFRMEAPKAQAMLSPNALIARAIGGGLGGILVGAFVLALLAALKGLKTAPTSEWQFVGPLVELVQPSEIGDWLQLVGLAVFGIMTGLVTAALSAARRAGGKVNGDPDDE